MEKKVLALLGDFYHSKDYLYKGIINSINGLDIEIIEKEPTDCNLKNLEEFNLIIIASAGKLDPENSEEIWMAEKEEKLLTEYVKKGGSILTLHSGLVDYSNNKDYREMLKGEFLYHPEPHPQIEIKVVEKSHPITEGVSKFEVTDEMYFVDCEREDTTVLLEIYSEGFGSSTAGWAHQYGQGKFCVLTPGHTIEVLTHPMMERLISNAIKWCL